MEVALFEPRIPQNTGSIARTCAAFNISLNLIEPLGFKLEDKYLKRAGLDYHNDVQVKIFDNLFDCCDDIGKSNFFFITKFGKKICNKI